MENIKADLTLSNSSIDQLIEWARWVDFQAQRISELSRNFILALEEVSRCRLDAREGARPLDWDGFLEKLRTQNKDVAERLKPVKLDRFSLGRLAIRVESDQEYNFLTFQRDWLGEYLHEHYGSTFKIKIRRLTD